MSAAPIEHSPDHVVVDVTRLQEFCAAALRAAGAPHGEAAAVADVLVRTEARGVWTHGTQTLPNHMRNVRDGGVDPGAVPEIVRESATTALIDANATFGFVAALNATDVAIDKCRASGVATVLVRNSNHFGAAGHYALRIAEAGLIGLAMGNASPSMTGAGSRRKVICNAPLAYGIPGVAFPIVLDIAMSATAAMKVRLASERGEPVPAGWIVDRDGVPTTNPRHYLEGGALVPMGNHKGYGLALFVELMSAGLSGAAMTGAVIPWLLVTDKPTNVGHAFVAIDPERFMDSDEFRGRVTQLMQEMHDAEPAPGVDRVVVPGELEHERELAAGADGMPLLPVVWAHLREAAAEARLEAMLESART